MIQRVAGARMGGMASLPTKLQTKKAGFAA